MNENHIKEVFSDEAFVNELISQDSYEKVQDMLAEKDIDLSVEEIKKLVELMEKHPDGQLTEEELESISGGVTPVVFGGLAIIISIGLGALGVGINEAVIKPRKNKS